jgi:hypothetical protein
MALTLTIGGRPYEVAPFMLRELRKAAPFVDSMNTLVKKIEGPALAAAKLARADAVEAGKPEAEAEADAQAAAKAVQPSMEDLFALSRALCEIIAVGLVKIDPKLDADWLEGQIDLSYLSSLQTGARALLRESGMSTRGEQPAPSSSPESGVDEPEPAPALENNSAE